MPPPSLPRLYTCIFLPHGSTEQSLFKEPYFQHPFYFNIQLITNSLSLSRPLSVIISKIGEHECFLLCFVFVFFWGGGEGGAFFHNTVTLYITYTCMFLNYIYISIEVCFSWRHHIFDKWRQDWPFPTLRIISYFVPFWFRRFYFGEEKKNYNNNKSAILRTMYVKGTTTTTTKSP